jgi:hypothetical protein
MLAAEHIGHTSSGVLPELVLQLELLYPKAIDSSMPVLASEGHASHLGQHLGEQRCRRFSSGRPVGECARDIWNITRV